MTTITFSTKTSKHGELFRKYLERLEQEVIRFYAQVTPNIDIWIKRYYSIWNNARSGDRVLAVSRQEQVRFGELLGRVAEGYSRHDIAEEVFDRLTEDALDNNSAIAKPIELLITAGEFNRRRVNLPKAQARFMEAKKYLEDRLITAQDLTVFISLARQLGRVLYELAYIERFHGNAMAEIATLDHSARACTLGHDPVGASIARTLQAMVFCEEEGGSGPISTIQRELQRLSHLAEDETMKRERRDGFARRWIRNAHLHLVQALLTNSNVAAAREVFEVYREHEAEEPSRIGLVTLRRIEAQLCLAEGLLDEAHEAIGKAWNASEEHASLALIERGASTVAVAGVIHVLQGLRTSANDCFTQARNLPIDLHNHIAHGWAAMGDAILKMETGDRQAAREAVFYGLHAVQHCGAPTRRALLHLWSAVEGDSHFDVGSWLSTLQLLVTGAPVFSAEG